MRHCRLVVVVLLLMVVSRDPGLLGSWGSARSRPVSEGTVACGSRPAYTVCASVLGRPQAPKATC